METNFMFSTLTPQNKKMIYKVMKLKTVTAGKSEQNTVTGYRGNVS